MKYLLPIKCAACGAELDEIEIFSTPLCDACERRAADLWRRENPQQSVFALSHQTQVEYRQRIIDEATK